MCHRSGGSGVPLTGSRLGVAFGGDPRYAWVAMGNSSRGYGEPQIGVLERASGRLYRRTEEIGGAFRPVASPDGKWLVYGTRKDGVTALKLVDLSSGDERILVDAVDRDNMEGTPTRDYLPDASFTPDSRALVASDRGSFCRVEVADGRATPIPFTADVDIGLAPLARFDYAAPDSVVTARRIEHPRRSPDGRMLAFSALARRTGHRAAALAVTRHAGRRGGGGRVSAFGMDDMVAGGAGSYNQLHSTLLVEELVLDQRLRAHQRCRPGTAAGSAGTSGHAASATIVTQVSTRRPCETR